MPDRFDSAGWRLLELGAQLARDHARGARLALQRGRVDPSDTKHPVAAALRRHLASAAAHEAEVDWQHRCLVLSTQLGAFDLASPRAEALASAALDAASARRVWPSIVGLWLTCGERGRAEAISLDARRALRQSAAGVGLAGS